VHGGQQLAFWNAHYDERGFAPMHIYNVAQRDDRALERPPNPTGGVAGKVVIKLQGRGVGRKNPSSTLSEQNVAKDCRD
jgi:hypothetical protein